eukprot:gene19946-25912_t
MSEIKLAAERILKADRIVVFTGAGMSADSGIDTFRGSGGIWSGISGYFLLLYGGTPFGWNLTPSITWSMFIRSFYSNIINAKPHEGFYALTRLQTELFHDNIEIITMNVDGLHQSSGFQSDLVYEVHGSIRRFRCSNCNSSIDIPNVTTTAVKCPHCNRGYSRPDVTLFTESLPSDQWSKSIQAINKLTSSDVMLVIGTSSVVYPAAHLPNLAKKHGVTMIEVNPQEITPLHNLIDIHIKDKAFPSAYPTDYPTKSPRFPPTHRPTKAPRPNPTQQPTKTPINVPSKKPTDWSNSYHPTLTPIFVPTVPPTKSPIFVPTNAPTRTPHFPPTHQPFTTAQPTSYCCVKGFDSSIPLYANFSVGDSVQVNSYTSASIITSEGTLYDFPAWCSNYFAPIAANSFHTESLLLTWGQIIADPNLANVILPLALNQAAWIVNNVKIGDTASGPQTLLNAATQITYTYTGCGTITASQIQAAIWYLVNYGKCNADDTTFSCPDSIYTDEPGFFCNVAYIVNKALVFVPEGTDYTVPCECAGDVIEPVIIVTPNGQPLLLSATIKDWGYQCSCPANTPSFPPTIAPSAPTPQPNGYCCVDDFDNYVPRYANFSINDPVQDNSYVIASLIASNDNLYTFPSWCSNFFSPIQANTYTTESLMYTWKEIVNDPSLANIVVPSNLNQVGWILNNIKVGDTAFGPQTLWTNTSSGTHTSYTYTGCTTISASNIQSAIWYLVDFPSCWLSQTKYHCTESLHSEDPGFLCNLAYIVNSALTYVPEGTTYHVPCECNGNIIEPVIIVTPGMQPLILAATISEWGFQCGCPAHLPTPKPTPYPIV